MSHTTLKEKEKRNNNIKRKKHTIIRKTATSSDDKTCHILNCAYDAIIVETVKAAEIFLITNVSHQFVS